MKSIIIAAGMGTRLKHMTQDAPKCLMDIAGKSILQRQLDAYNALNITDISVVKGYLHEKINIPNLKYYLNLDYENNNILCSFMHAREELDTAFIASYSDILFESRVVQSLLDTDGDITIVVDTDWKDRYDGRTEHPFSEAEKVVLDEQGHVIKIGKVVTANEAHGEFIGMFGCSEKGAHIFKEYFEKAKQAFAGKPFMQAKIFDKAYITDFVQYLVDNGIKVKCATIQQGWYEIDTIQDIEQARRIFTNN